jgi:hypothetical protein
MLARAVFEDVSTPYEGPSRERLGLEAFGGFVLTWISGMATFLSFVENTSNKQKMLPYAGIVAGVALLGKFYSDYQKARRMAWEHAELLRKKYEDAVTIQQLVFAADLAA